MLPRPAPEAASLVRPDSSTRVQALWRDNRGGRSLRAIRKTPHLNAAERAGERSTWQLGAQLWTVRRSWPDLAEA